MYRRWESTFPERPIEGLWAGGGGDVGSRIRCGRTPNPRTIIFERAFPIVRIRRKRPSVMRLDSAFRISVLFLGSLAPGCSGQGDGREIGSTVTADEARPAPVESRLSQGDTVPGHPSWTREDLTVLQSTVSWALEDRLDTIPLGDRIGRIGERFVGTAYIPQTLDPPGPERLVVNLRAFDCVTFVESVLTLARVVGALDPTAAPPSAEALMDEYERLLTAIRYRGGERLGYPSRLHYFSEWIADNETKGFVRDVTGDLGGVVDPEPREFMTEHREAYWQMADSSVFSAIGEAETRLVDQPRRMIPEVRVGEVVSEIRTGDIIAATSTLPGLDVAHTGIALRRGGVLYLMHAPLVGESVQVSERPLADRLLDLSAQDGIMVARPIPPTAPPS